VVQELGIRDGSYRFSLLELESPLQGRTHPRLAPTISNILNNNLLEFPFHNAQSVQVDMNCVTLDSASLRLLCAKGHISTEVTSLPDTGTQERQEAMDSFVAEKREC
jgi:hypothetical protein